MLLLLLPALVVAVPVAAAADAAAFPTVTLDDALAQAAAHAPSVRAAEAAVTASDAQLAQAWSARLPSVSMSGNVLVYDDQQTFSLFPSDQELDCTLFEQVGMGDLCASFGEETVVRDQVTSSLTVRAALPLTGQVAIDRGVAAARASRDAARAAGVASAHDAAWQAEDAWFAALQVERQGEIVAAQLKSLEARVATATTAHEAGIVTRNDLLLAQLALASARQRALQLDAATETAYAALGLAIGNGGLPVRPAAPPDLPLHPPVDVDALVDRALASHPSLEALDHTVDAAHASAQAVSWGRLPSVAAMAAWQHNEGQGVFAQKDTYFAGAQLDWTVWAWGKAAAGVKAARANEARLSAQAEQARAGVRVDVRAKARAHAAAVAAHDVAAESITQARENLRIQAVRLDTGSGTMQELLDAEAALVTALSNEATALFDARRAEAALVRAVGADPWG